MQGTSQQQGSGRRQTAWRSMPPCGIYTAHCRSFVAGGAVKVAGRALPSARTCHKESVKPDGIEFASCKDSLYKSLYIHQSPSGTSHPKSIWALTPPAECHTFCEAELQNWRDDQQNCWSISQDAKVEFGTRGERIGFFVYPGDNPTVPWHGYPVGGRRGLPVVRRPPDALTESGITQAGSTTSRTRA